MSNGNPVLMKNIIYKKLNTKFLRDEYVISELEKLKPGTSILDAGCGSQKYREYCSHLNYKAQDFGKYNQDEKRSSGNQVFESYNYGELDFTGDIWSINAKDKCFDAILCTEVFEHIPYPSETLREFSRLLSPGGTLILTLPSNCLRHMDPYYFFSGFSDRWLEYFLPLNGFRVESIEVVGDYFSWMAVELARSARDSNIFSKSLLLPAFIYYFFKKRTEISKNTLCMGYFVRATKI